MAKNFTILLALCLICLSAAFPQWQPTNIDRLDQDGVRLSKDYKYKNGKSSAGVIGGYDEYGKFGFGLKASQELDQKTKVFGDVYKDKSGVEANAGFHHTFNEDKSSLQGIAKYDSYKKLGLGVQVSHKLDQKTKVFGDIYKDKSGVEANIGLSHTLDSGISVNAKAGRNSDGSKRIGIGVEFPLGKK